MHLGTTIIAIVITIIFTIPFVILGRNNKRKKNKLLQGLTKIADSHQCTISRFDVWAGNAIGIDDAKHRVFFTRKSNEAETLQQIDLSQIQKCRLINSSRPAGIKGNNFKVTSKLELAFSFLDKNRNDVLLEFYNADYDNLTLTGELQLAEKWFELCNTKIAELMKQKK